MRTAFILILIFGTLAFAQSGRRARPAAPTPTPTPEEKPSPTPSAPPREQVTAEKDQDYRCTNDGSLAHLLNPPEVAGFGPKEVDVKAEVTSQPEAGYTREARRAAIQGNVVLKVLLLANGKLDRVRVVRRVPYGLTENAIRAACEIKFKPAIKAGKEVSQWVTLEYAFRLAHSSIFGP
ncbi:MAG TPA: energy transducer TonB [Pyrinomonadaceae bacterium]|jgi:protein TonB|nr:energy transducer TonB [Pyrinomonadaceae bacterium]